MSDLPQAPAPLEPGSTGGGSAAGRLARVFFEPAAVFREIAAAPGWVLVLVALVAVSVAAQFVITPRIDMEATVRHAMEQRGRELTDEQLDQAIEGAEKWQGSPIAKSVGVVAAPIVYLIIAGVYFLGVRAMGSEVPFKPMFSGVLHASWPPVLTGSALTMIVAVQRQSFRGDEVEGLVKASAAAFLPESAPAALHAVASAFSLFNVWHWVLLVLAFQSVARLDRGKSIGVVAAVWAVWILLKVALAALGSAF